MKNFFKSKSFKCIIVLLVIVLIAGIFLAFCNSLFYVDASERLSRAISKLYDTSVTAEELDIEDENGNEIYDCHLDSATITNVYYVYENGDLVVKAKGSGGYGGNVTTWVAVENDGTKVTGIGSVLAQSSENSSESFIGNLSSDDFERFSYDYEEGVIYDYGYSINGGSTQGANYVATGASKSYRGVCNAVNGAIEFVNENIEDIMIQVNELIEEAAA